MIKRIFVLLGIILHSPAFLLGVPSPMLFLFRLSPSQQVSFFGPTSFHKVLCSCKTDVENASEYSHVVEIGKINHIRARAPPGPKKTTYIIITL